MCLGFWVYPQTLEWILDKNNLIDTCLTFREKDVGHPKIQNNFWYPIKCPIFHYCNSNIAPFLVIAIQFSSN